MSLENEYPPNSRRARSEPQRAETPDAAPIEKRAEKVVVGKVVRKKPSLGQKFMKTFFTGDTSSVGGYLVHDVIVPMIKTLVTDIVTQGVERAVYGESRPQRPHRPGYGNRSHISYDHQYRSVPGRQTPATGAMRRPPATQPDASDVQGIILDSYQEADAVVTKMSEILQQYGIVTVGDLNDLTGQTSVYTDYNFGWMSMHGITHRRVAGGYELLVPEPEDLRQ